MQVLIHQVALAIKKRTVRKINTGGPLLPLFAKSTHAFTPTESHKTKSKKYRGVGGYIKSNKI